MQVENWIMAFMDRIQKDPRVSVVHIGIFSVMAHFCNQSSGTDRCVLFRQDLMKAAKISSPATYYKIINELSEYGYIGYVPSKCPSKGSLITLLPTADPNRTKNLTT